MVSQQQQQVSPGSQSSGSEIVIPGVTAAAAGNPPYPSQYSETPASVASEVIADSRHNDDEDIPRSPPPPYQPSEDQSSEATSIVESTGSLAETGNAINKALQHTVQYTGDNNSDMEDSVVADSTDPLSSSPTLHSNDASKTMVGNRDSSVTQHSKQFENNMQSDRTISRVRDNGDTGNAISTPNRTTSEVSDTQHAAAFHSNTDSANIPRDSSSNHKHRLVDNRSSKSTDFVVAARDAPQGNANHHNHNLHTEKSNVITSKENIASASGSQVPPAVSNNNRQNSRLEGQGGANYAGMDDPMEVQRFMDNLGVIDGMFQFEDLGTRTDALDDAAPGFSSFRKPSGSGGS